MSGACRLVWIFELAVVVDEVHIHFEFGRGGGWDVEEGPTAVTCGDIGVSFLKFLPPFL